MPCLFRDWVVLASILSLALAIPASAEDVATAPKASPAKPDAPKVPKPRVLVTISKETTYITAPLRADGYPDYVAAINQRCRQGVTPENNAAVLFWKAMGPGRIVERDRKEYFEMLGIPELPKDGNYFVPSDTWVARQKNKDQPDAKQPEKDYDDPLWEQQKQAMQRPWSTSEFPVWAEWIAANEKPLALLIEASKRPRRFDPMLGGIVLGALLPAVHEYRDVSRALVARAMLRIHEGRVDEAHEDLLACHRLARLASQGPTLVDVMVGFTIDQAACRGDRVLLQDTQLTAARVKEMCGDMAKLQPMPRVADRIDIAERFTCLDFLLTVARQGRDYAPTSELTESFNAVGNLVNAIPATAIDWDGILRLDNSWYDRTVEAIRKPARAEREKAICTITEDLRKLGKSSKDFGSLALLMLGDSRRAVSQRLGEIFVAMFLPATSTCVAMEDRCAMDREFTKLAFVLAAYRADHGSYPAKLGDLVPKYIADLPKDIFSDAEPHYRREGAGYVLYSVGSNGKDDGGRGFEHGRQADECRENGWDDLVVRMPAAK